MDEISFIRDWELSESLNKLARDYLTNGVTVDETMQLVLNSAEYKLWNSIPRSFQINIEHRRHYEDLLGEIKWKKYTDEIDTYIYNYFTDSKSEKPVDQEPYDHIYAGLGIQVTAKQLGYEIAQLSKLTGVDKPLSYSHLLCLFNGTLISDLEEAQLNCLLSHEEAVSAFVGEFYERYRIKDDNEDLS